MKDTDTLHLDQFASAALYIPPCPSNRLRSYSPSRKPAKSTHLNVQYIPNRFPHAVNERKRGAGYRKCSYSTAGAQGESPSVPFLSFSLSITRSSSSSATALSCSVLSRSLSHNLLPVSLTVLVLLLSILWSFLLLCCYSVSQ